MTSLFVAMMCLAAGPELDLINGASITDSEREWLPSGRDLSSIADVWLVQTSNQQVSGAGIARFDPIRLGFHGSSWTQTRFLLNGLEMTDPARSGSPLLELPYNTWDRLEFRYQLYEKPGFNTVYSSRNAKPDFEAEFRSGVPIGGGTWVPQGFMDREPATFFGATSVRRELHRAYEGEVQMSHQWKDWGIHLGAEHYDHTHRYPTFVDAQGKLLKNKGVRTAVVGGIHGNLMGQPLDLVAAWQGHSRSHAGAQLRWPVAYTKAVEHDAGVVQAIWDASPVVVKAGFGFGMDKENRITDDPFVRDIEEEWMWLERFRDAENSTRWRADANLVWDLKPESTWLSSAHLTWVTHRSEVETQPNWGSSLEGVTYLRSDTEENKSVSMIDWQLQQMRQWWQGARAKLDFSGKYAGISWKSDVGLDLVQVGVPNEALLGQWALFGGITLQRDVGDFEVFGIARREPEEMTVEVARFLDPHAPHGIEYAWDDSNGDGLPQRGEEGSVKRRSGGKYHRIDPQLDRPTRNLFSLGVKSPQFGPFVFVAVTHFRWLKNKFTVRHTPNTEANYTPTTVADPGKSREITVYNREEGGQGEEEYWLTNASWSDFFFGTELQLKTVGTSGWFFNLSASGYLSQGSGVFGSFPDRNDSGILHEITADPNARINQRGRYDNCRAFGINLLTGVEFFEDMRWGLAARYRDGEPMTRYLVAELEQGPTPIMAMARGAPIPRHTFHLTLDTRLSYSFDFAGWKAVASVDVFNLMGSGTELLEDIRTGPMWRTSLEMVPGRTILGMLKLTH